MFSSVVFPYFFSWLFSLFFNSIIINIFKFLQYNLCILFLFFSLYLFFIFIFNLKLRNKIIWKNCILFSNAVKLLRKWKKGKTASKILNWNINDSWPSLSNYSFDKVFLPQKIKKKCKCFPSFKKKKKSGKQGGSQKIRDQKRKLKKKKAIQERKGRVLFGKKILKKL